jgi:hypothetical protein
MKPIELTADEIAGSITVTVSVTKAARQLRRRIRLATMLFKLGTWVIGCKYVQLEAK